MKFSLRCYPNNSDYVNDILKSAVHICEKQTLRDFEEDSLKNIVKFLTMPLETMSLTILQMDEYPNLMKYLPFTKRRFVALKICQAVVTLKNNLNDKVIVTQLLKFINPLLVTEKDYVDVDQVEFEEEQLNVAKLVHLVRAKTVFTTLEILKLFQGKFMEGEIKRMKFTMPALVFVYIKIIRFYTIMEEEEIDIKNLLGNIRKLIELLEKDFPEVALKLYLDFTLCINNYDKNAEVKKSFILLN